MRGRVTAPVLPTLLVPATFGQWLLNGNQLVCRLPRNTVTVNAPRKLLKQICTSCDGVTSWKEVVDRLSLDWEASKVVAFMQELTINGLLVEASQLWAHWGELAQLPTVTAVATSPTELEGLPAVAEKRLLPGRGEWHGAVSHEGSFASLLSQRESTRTFDDAPISSECLYSVLWAGHGVIRLGASDSVKWHRTVPSAGNMHSVRWFVAVLRDLPSGLPAGKTISTGIYEARFHKLGGVSLQSIKAATADPSNDPWRCLQDPRILRFASSLILPVYDVSTPGKKYGNRATLFAAMEAGQSLQNAQLMSFELGASSMLRGDTTAKAVLEMLNLHNGPLHWFVVPGMVLGARPSGVQSSQQRGESVLKIVPNVRTSKHSFAFASMPTTSQSITAFAGSGRSDDPKLALTTAEAEGWERMAWSTPVSLVEGRFPEMPQALDPRSAVAYSARQYAQEEFPFVPFSSRRQYLWSSATDVATGKKCHVLADLVFAHTSLASQRQAKAFSSASTSGMAAGTSFSDALTRAALELVERDAFVNAWLSRRAPPVVKDKTLPKSTTQRISALRTTGFRVVVSDLSSGWAPVISVFAQNEQLPFTAITAAAAFSTEHALEKALDEIEGRIAQAEHFPIPTKKDIDPMRQIERFYRVRASYRNSDFYVQTNNEVRFGAVGSSACQSWNQLQSCILGDGFELLAVDMTPPGAAVEQGRTPLHVARAFIPGLVPIWFQNGLQPEGMPRFAEAVGGVRGKHTSRFFVHPFT